MYQYSAKEFYNLIKGYSTATFIVADYSHSMMCCRFDTSEIVYKYVNGRNIIRAQHTSADGLYEPAELVLCGDTYDCTESDTVHGMEIEFRKDNSEQNIILNLSK